MSIHLPSVGGYDPYWGPQTSHMNFCEEDYHMTSYIGEFINTFTSLFYAYLGFRGIAAVWSRRELAITSVLPYVAVIVLGIASGLFHATLQYPMQLHDNSMLFGAATMLHRLFTHTLSPLPTILIFLALNASVCVAIYAHIALGESTLHQVVFGGMMFTSAFRTAGLITTTVGKERVRREMRVVGGWALGLFITGYILWNIDNQFCDALRSIRHTVGLPWAWVLELHGWWHILTGLGVYLHTLLVECLCPLDQREPIPLGNRVPGWAVWGAGAGGRAGARAGAKSAKGGKSVTGLRLTGHGATRKRHTEAH